MIRYAITDGLSMSSSVERWSAAGVDYVQLRNKTAAAAELTSIAATLLHALRETGIRVLINGRLDVAMSVAAAGVHLTSSPEELLPQQVRQLWRDAIISRSCHTVEEALKARNDGVDLILFGPVFEKRVGGELLAGGSGLGSLAAAAMAATPVPVIALGGVDASNTASCLESGAAGVAGIRLFESWQGPLSF